MKNKFLSCFILFFVFAGLKVLGQSGEGHQRYTISWINQIVLDQENGNDIENYIAVFSTLGDSLTVYKWSIENREAPQKTVFWGQRSQTATVHFLSTDGGDIKVVFLGENKITVDSDLYIVNKPYYVFLQQKLLVETSVLDLAFFLKESYGDYSVDLELLTQKNWRNQKENPRYRIIEVDVKNRNEQTDDQFHNWKAVYTYNVNGMLQRISGEYYTKKLVSNKGDSARYLIEQNLDRSSVRTTAYQNTKTLLDSVSVAWTQFTTSREFQYSRYQSKLKLVSTDKKPGNFREIAKLLKLRNR